MNLVAFTVTRFTVRPPTRHVVDFLDVAINKVGTRRARVHCPRKMPRRIEKRGFTFSFALARTESSTRVLFSPVRADDEIENGSRPESRRFVATGRCHLCNYPGRVAIILDQLADGDIKHSTGPVAQPKQWKFVCTEWWFNVRKYRVGRFFKWKKNRIFFI